MKEIRNEKLKNQIKVLIEIIDQASPEERVKLAEEIRMKKEKMESKAGKELMGDLECYARNGFIQINIQQKPTSGAAEVSK